MLRSGVILLTLMVLAGVMPTLAQDGEYSGFLDENVPSKSYPVYLDVGDTILVTTEAADGDLDTVVSLLDPDGTTVAENDDRSGDSLDSALGYTAPEAGNYTVVVRRYENSDTSGHYSVEIVIGDESLLASLEEITRLQLSGTPRVRDTEHFRIHYTLDGVDATTEAYVNALVLSVEEIWRIQIDRMGWQPPPSDGIRGGNGLYDVYLVDLIGQGDDALGYAVPEDLRGDNPDTEGYIENGATSYIALENDFDLPFTSDAAVTSLMRSTMSHEFNHAIQFAYEVDDMNWFYEATATWIETVVLAKDEDASGYVEYVYKYPELCFGTEGDDAGGLSVYGEWLFIQAMTDAYGEDVVQRLWENVATYSGFEALEQTVTKYDDTLVSMLATYHVQNVVRDYTLAPDFNVTVWTENTIDDVGRWTFTGKGVQELGANYFRVQLEPGTYYAGLANDDGALALWAVGVRGEEADAIPLGRGGSFTTEGYEYVYLMVFNPAYDDTVYRCDYAGYSLDISTSKSALNPVTRTWSAANFEPLN